MLTRHRVVFAERELLGFLLGVPFGDVEISGVGRAGHFNDNGIWFGHISSVNLRGRCEGENIPALDRLSSMIGDEAGQPIG